MSGSSPGSDFKTLGTGVFNAITVFVRNMDVVENELLSTDRLAEPFRGMVERFLGRLASYRLLTYGQLIAHAVEQLKNASTFDRVHKPLRHLIVDEYQDVNPAQEALIARLATYPVELCVVGDDDRTLYQWRGSDVGNILGFEHRYPNVATFRLEVNRRSKPRIVATANAFVKSISPRLQKSMSAFRKGDGSTEVVTWSAATEAQEADTISATIVRLHELGLQYRDIAILVRGRVSYRRLLEALHAREIPIQPVGRTDLFMQDDAQLFGRTCAYLAGHEWRPTTFGSPSEPVLLKDLSARYAAEFDLDKN